MDTDTPVGYEVFGVEFQPNDLQDLVNTVQSPGWKAILAILQKRRDDYCDDIFENPAASHDDLKVAQGRNRELIAVAEIGERAQTAMEQHKEDTAERLKKQD